MKKKVKGKCRHCGKDLFSTRPVGLCGHCYADVAVRNIYLPSRAESHRPSQAVLADQVPVVPAGALARPGEPACACGRPLRSYTGTCEDCTAAGWGNLGSMPGHTPITQKFPDNRTRIERYDP